MSDNYLKDEENTYTPEWFRKYASEEKYKSLKDKADKERSEFLDNYGPDVLKSLNGKELLLKMFKGPNNSNGDYLINVLENRTGTFGSGNLGNAHNAGLLYKDKWETPGWAKRKGYNAEAISEDEAISLCEGVRDALIKAVDYFSENDFDSIEAYKNADSELKNIFQSLNPVFRYNYIWVIKYFQMVFPDLFPVFYSSEWIDYVIEKLHLSKTNVFLEKFGVIALYIKKCGIENTVFGTIIYDKIGCPDKFKTQWLYLDYNTGLDVQDWKELIADKTIFTESAIDVIHKFYDIGGMASCSQLAEIYGQTPDYYKNNAVEAAKRVAERKNIELAKSKDGELKYWPILFVGKNAKKDYNGSFIWKLRDEVTEAITSNDSELAIISKEYDKTKFLEDVYMTETQYDRLVSVLLKKKNIILQGAPGVGKTFTAKKLAYSVLNEIDDNRIEFVQFHQNYSYEDFMMGYKPCENGFRLKTGVFYSFCKKALNDRDNKYFFIIDEINRGNMSKIFGELLMLIENEYRGHEVKLAYNGEFYSVPKNLYIIGMMNTADRSLAMIDYALRRRFSFVDMHPGFETAGFVDYMKTINNSLFDSVVETVIELNKAISNDRTLGPGFCIGHSYFCNLKECSNDDVTSIVEYDILPMLREYWFDDNKSFEYWKSRFEEVLDEKFNLH